MSRFVKLACCVYRLLLYAYPPGFRSQYGRSMVTLFRDRLRETVHRQHPPDLIHFAVDMLRDWLVTALHERIISMNKTAFVASVFAFAAGLYAAYVDFHATEELATLLVIVVPTFLLGILYGRLGWLWALIVAACLTGAHIIAPYFGVFPRDGTHIGNPLSLMILALPAAVSAYFGAGVRFLARHSHS